MATLSIKVFPDPILKKKAAKVARVGSSESRLLSDMAETMYLNQGVGLAATQVGIDKDVAVIDVGEGLIKLINPVILRKEGRETQEEGCLSVPDVRVDVRRAKRVVVSYMNEKGEVEQMKAEGLLARAIQHEVDHLSGTLILDHLNPVKKLLLKRKSLTKRG